MTSVNDPVSTLVRLVDGRVVAIVGKPPRNILEVIVVGVILVAVVVYLGKANANE